jgi:hypothetical protein
MAKIKVTKSAVDAAEVAGKDDELRDTIVPAFVCKVPARGCNVFRANVTDVGTHGIRHRAATDIANSQIPVKVGMALTAHKTVSMFMRYVHAEDDPIRAAAEKVANLRWDTIDSRAPMVPVASPAANTGDTDCNKALTSRGNYRPYRHRKESRAVPPGSKRDVISEEEAA